MDQNICRFIPYNHQDENIHTLYFVYEQNFNALPQNQMLAFYKLCLVVSGEGTFTMHGKSYDLHPGDLFFIFPSVTHNIHSNADEGDPHRLKCIYVSFIGIRANQIMSRFHITSISPVYSGHSDLIPFWENAIRIAGKNNLDLISESVLLYTLSVIGATTEESEEMQSSNLIQNIKKYVDEHFSDQDLSLNSICAHYNYNPKYISTLFKKYFKVGINEYVNTIRIQEACTLIDDNMTSVKDIAARCGFRDQYYFSRVFKIRLGISPSQYIQNYKKCENNI